MNQAPDPAEQPKTGPVAANSTQDEGECGSESPKPAERHTAVLSDHQDAERRAASTPAQGGYIPGDPIPCTVDTLRVIEPGLSVASINGAAPEYVMSADWIRRNAHRIQPADMRAVADWLNQTADTTERGARQ